MTTILNHHQRHIHDCSDLSFRAKTVYKVVTVVQPPFMMWNATTGDGYQDHIYFEKEGYNVHIYVRCWEW